ncbi:MAG: polysaccharide deacetylase family protein [Candidatus Limnocylindrales bacterium]
MHRRAVHPLTGLLATLGTVALVTAACGLGPGPTASTMATPSAIATPSARRTPEASPTVLPSPTFLAYVAQPGDNLTSLALRFSTTARSIAFWNRATYPSLDPLSEGYQPDAIQAGWRLVLLPGSTVDETASLPPGPPTALPSTSVAPSVRPSVPIPNLPPAGSPSVVVEHGPRGSGLVALTFDMGGRLDPAVATVEWLVGHRVQATVFPTGATGSGTDAGRQVLALLAAHRDLFRIGNHSWDHPYFTQLTATAIADQLQRTEAAVAPLAGSSTKPFFRPPYGAQDATVRTAVGAAGWACMVLWDVDTVDWKPESDGGPTTDDIVARVLSRAQGGSIVLMHLGGYNTLEALPAIVDGLRARGLEPVTLGEMLGT